MVSWVKLRDAGDPKNVLWLFNTHFDHLGAEARIRSAEALRDTIAAKTGFARTIVTGDFNAPVDSADAGPYQVLTARSENAKKRLVDAYRSLHEAGSNEGTYHGFTGQSDGARVDWILVTPDLVPQDTRIARSNVEGRNPSDHFPVISLIQVLPLRPPSR